MGKYALACLVIFALQLSSLLNTLACPYCTDPSHVSSPPPPPPPKKSPPPPCVPHASPAPVATPSQPPPKAPKSSPPPPKAPKSSPPPAKAPKSSPPPPKAPKSSPPPAKAPKSSPPPAKAPKSSPPSPKAPISSPPAPKAPMSSPSSPHYCPIDTIKLGACVDVLGGLLHIVIGRNVRNTCCPLLHGVADLDAALCLCTALRARALNIDLLLPISLEALVNNCGFNPPSGFQCPHY